MSVQHFVLRPHQHQPALNVVGTQVTVLAANATTQSYGITLQQGEEGTGPPPHSHDWDEAFYVLKGEINFLCDGNAYACSAGGQMLEITGAGALAAQMFTAVDNEIAPGPPDVPRLLDVLKRNGVTVAV
jgi:uncharacterized cupin superfamily protein